MKDKEGAILALQAAIDILREAPQEPQTALIQAPPVARLVPPEEPEEVVSIPKSAVGWLFGGALLVLVGALAVLACVTEEKPNNGRGWGVDDLLQ